MKPEQIKAKLVSSGIHQADIARNITPPVTRQAINRTIHGVMRSEKIEAEIARALGISKTHVFPRRRRR